MEVDGYPVLDPFVKYMELDWKGKLDLGHLNWLADFNEEEKRFFRHLFSRFRVLGMTATSQKMSLLPR